MFQTCGLVGLTTGLVLMMSQFDPVLGGYLPPSGLPACVSDCRGREDGDYQSCTGCRVYVTCHNGRTTDNRPCPANLVWDDYKKRCEWKSATCTTVPDVPACVSDCRGREDGDYQSCTGCRVYVTCHNGRTTDNRPCPANLVWDDFIKRCEWTSATCTTVPDVCRGIKCLRPKCKHSLYTLPGECCPVCRELPDCSQFDCDDGSCTDPSKPPGDCCEGCPR